MKKTKIIATIGPASANAETLTKIISNGANVIRINFSHGNIALYKQYIDLIKQVREELNTPVAIMIDTRGPEIRVKTFADNQVTLKRGKEFTLYKTDKVGNENGVSVTEPNALGLLRTGDRIYACDGLIKFKVLENNGDVKCNIMQGGEIKNNKALTMLDTPLNLPYISTKDRKDIAYCVNEGVEIIACSFVNSASDILEIKKLLKTLKSEIKVIAKIESATGVKNVNEILEVSDGIMVARGDLGVEISPFRIPKVQRKLVDSARLKGKIAIVATEMLESMVHSPRPTRAEASDVANAVYSGASCVMLSAESAIGEYPIEAVNAMSEICIQTEKDINYKNLFTTTNYSIKDTTDVISHSCVSASFNINCKAIVIYTDKGKNALKMSRFLPGTTILAISTNKSTYNYLSSIWGVTSQFIKTPPVDIFKTATKIVKELELANKGDNIIIATGSTDNLNNVMKISKIN